MLSTSHLLAQQLEISEEDIAKAHEDPSPEEFCITQDPFYLPSGCYVPYAKNLLKSPFFITLFVTVLFIVVFALSKIMRRRATK